MYVAKHLVGSVTERNLCEWGDIMVNEALGQFHEISL